MQTQHATSTFPIEIAGTGTINGVQFTATGSGTGDPVKGRLAFSVEFSKIPRGIDPFANLLGILIIETAVVGRELGDALSLMTLAGGVFEFTQEIAGERIHTTSVGKVISLGDKGFRWESMARGQVDLAEVTSIEPFDCVMIPAGRGHIIETIELPINGGGGRLPLHAVRHFSFSPASTLPQLQLRHIAIEPTVEQNTVSVAISSTITTFSNGDDARTE